MENQQFNQPNMTPNGSVSSSFRPEPTINYDNSNPEYRMSEVANNIPQQNNQNQNYPPHQQSSQFNSYSNSPKDLIRQQQQEEYNRQQNAMANIASGLVVSFSIDCVDPKTSKTITKNFSLQKWKPSEVIREIPVIGKQLAVPISMLFQGVGQEDEYGHVTTPMDNIATALLQLFLTMEEYDMVQLFDRLLRGVWCDNLPVQVDAFNNHPELLLPVIAKVLEVNFVPFFAKASSLIPSVMGLASLHQATSQKSTQV